MKSRSYLKPVPVFLVFLCIFSAIAYALIVTHSAGSLALSRLMMWCPGLAALCTCLVLRIPFGTLGWRWPDRRFLLLAYFRPLIFVTPVYVLTWLCVRNSFAWKGFETTMAGKYGLERWPALGTLGVGLSILFTGTVLGATIWTLGEELGWRGFLFPRFYEELGFRKACFLTGLLWAVWHYPMVLRAEDKFGTHVGYAIACFTVMMVAIAYIMGYLRAHSDSIWPCVLLHAAFDTFVQDLFDPLTAPTGRAKYITTEFGFGIAAALVVAAVLINRNDRREEESLRRTAVTGFHQVS